MTCARLCLSLLLLACRGSETETEEGKGGGDSASAGAEGAEGGEEGASADSGGGDGSAEDGGAEDGGAEDGGSGEDGSGEDGSADSGGDSASAEGGDGSSADSGAEGSGGDSGGSDGGEAGEEPGCLPYGLTIFDQASLAYGSLTDSYDASAGPYSAEAAGEAASLAVGGADACDLRLGGQLLGDVYVSSSTAGIYCEDWGVELSGSALELPEALVAPTFAAPTDLPASEGDLWVGYGEVLDLGADATYGALSLGSGSRLVVSASSRLLVDSFAVDNATVEIAPGAVLQLHVLGDLSLNWGSMLNISGEPGQLQVLLIGGGALALRNGAELVARVYAPESAVGHAGAFSGVMMARSLQVDWGAQTHVDSASICP